MITVKEADNFIFKNCEEFPARHVPLRKAFGMVLREDLIADRDQPPFDRVTMDGIAINFSSFESGNRGFPVEGIQKAGNCACALTLKDKNNCIEVMTGAPLPSGCDCIVPVEEININNGKAQLQEKLQLTRMMSVHSRGSDRKRGECLVQKGCRLLSPQVAVAAAIGNTEVLVTQQPKIAVIGTGDELVDIDQKIQTFQIRQSNSYALQSALALSGYTEVTRFHIKDDKDELRSRFDEILKSFDVLVISGGVSMGKFDYIPEILNELGIQVLFHKVKQRPGKPFWFGESKEGKPVFALPGNPVSTQIGLVRYVYPFLEKASGIKELKEEFAVLNEDVDIDTAFTYFLPVKIKVSENGCLGAFPVTPNGSGDYASLAQSDGFIELPAETYQFSKGTATRLYRWKL